MRTLAGLSSAATIPGAAVAALGLLLPAASAQSRFRTIYDSVPVGSTYSVLTVIETGDGGFATAGNTGGSAFLLKVKSDGTLAFFDTYNFFSSPGLAETATGFVLAGEELSYNNPTILVVDGGGIPQWAKSYDLGYGEQGFYAVHPTPDGGYLASGIPTLKVDGSGNPLWSKLHIGGGGNVNGTAITGDGGSVLTGEGQHGNTAANYNAVVTRMDADGAIKWNKVYGGDDYDWSADVKPTLDGGYIVTGWTRSFTPGNTQACFLLKLDGSGALEWANTYAGGGRSECHGVAATGDGGYAMAGGIDGELLLAKTDKLGSLEWAWSYGGSSLGHSIQQTADDGFIAAGVSGSSLTLLKTDRDGDAATCNQVKAVITVAAAAFLTGDNTTGSVMTWTPTDLSPVASTSVPAEKNICNQCTPAPRAQVSATELCQGASVDLGALGSGIPGCTGAIEYRWRGTGGFLRDWSTVPDATDTPLVDRSYTLDLRCTSPVCQGSAAPLAVTVHLPPAVAAGGSLATCPGQTIGLGGVPTASGGAPPYDYNWSAAPPDPSMSCNSGPGCANPSVAPALTTTYTLVVTDARGCAAPAQDVTVTLNSPPAADAGPARSSCAGNPVTLGGAPTASGGAPPYDYAWVALPPDPTLSCSSGQACANPGASPGTTTTYTVTVTDSAGCSVNAASAVTVTVPAPPPDPGNSLTATRALRAIPPDPTGIAFAWADVLGSAVAYGLRRSDARDFAPPNGIVQSVPPGQGVVLRGEVSSSPRLRFYRVTSSNCAGDESPI